MTLLSREKVVGLVVYIGHSHRPRIIGQHQVLCVYGRVGKVSWTFSNSNLEELTITTVVGDGMRS